MDHITRLPRKLKKKYKEAFLHDMRYRNIGIKLHTNKRQKAMVVKRSPLEIQTYVSSLHGVSLASIKRYVKAVLRNKKMHDLYLKRKRLRHV